MKTITTQEHNQIVAIIGEGLTTLAEAVLEKDLLLTQLLHTIASVDSNGIGLVFCGGTCLSKAHCLIERMSEDVDFKLVVPEGLSRNAKSRRLSQLKKHLAAIFEEAGYIVPPQEIIARDENSYFCLNLHYKSQFAPVASLRPEIKVEFSARTPTFPTISLLISTMLGSLLQQAITTDCKLDCISIEETVAEKVLSFLRRTAEVMANRNRGDYDNRLVRHLYDVQAISDARPDLKLPYNQFSVLVAGDAVQFRNQFPEFEQNPAGQLEAALDALMHRPDQFEEDYNRFVNELVFGKQVSFKEASTTFIKMAEQLLKQIKD